MARAMQMEEELGGPHNRDYDIIATVEDDRQYWELHDRPLDWSDKKAKISMESGIPLGKAYSITRFFFK